MNGGLAELGASLAFGGVLCLAYLWTVWPIHPELTTIHGLVAGVVLTSGTAAGLYAIDTIRTLLTETKP